jgi:hypothetical protein
VDIVIHSALVTVSFLGVVSEDLIPMPNAVSNAINYAKFFSRSHHAVIRVCDEAGNVIETHEHT